MKAIYVSIWDGDVEIRTQCEFDPDTKKVWNIQSADVNVDILEDEFVELPDGTEVRDFTNLDVEE